MNNHYQKQLAVMRVFYLMIYSSRKIRKLVLLLKIRSLYFSMKYKNLDKNEYLNKLK
jgi:hypothetical protein